jgi:hypothetical protein
MNRQAASWASQDEPNIWTPLTTNTAGFIRVSRGSQIVCAIATRQEILVYTEGTLNSFQFLGTTDVFGLTELSDKELSDKIMDLERKMMMAYRVMPSSIHQFSMIMEDYKSERQARLSKEFDKLSKQTGSDLNKLIDVK